jgi:hypothetical protein
MVTHVAGEARRHVRQAKGMSGVQRKAIVGVVALAVVGLGMTPALAATPSSTPSATGWQTNGPVHSVVYAGGRVYIGGAFTSVRPPGSSSPSTVRNHIAAFSATTGALLSWNPNVDNIVRGIAVGPTGTVYIGGQFATVHGVKRYKLAALTVDTGAPTSWAPNPNALVRTVGLSSDGSVLYAGGDFTAVRGVTRQHAVAISTSGTGSVTSWRADTTSSAGAFTNVTSLVVAGSRVYLGGNFTAVNGTSRVNSAAVSSSTGAVQSWKASTPVTVLGLATDGTRLFVGGRGSGGFLRAFSVSTGAQVWKASADGDVQAIAVRGSELYVGGHFNTLQGATRHHLAALTTSAGALLGWNPNVNGSVGITALGTSSTAVGAGGDYTLIGGVPQQDFAQFTG